MSIRPLHPSSEARRTIISLAEAFRRCLLLPGAVGELMTGGGSSLRAVGQGTRVLRFRVVKVDVPGNGLVITVPLETEAVAPGEQVRLFFAREEGIYVGGGVVQERRISQERVPLVHVWLPTLRMVQERRQVRVHVPGARATLRIGERTASALVLNLNSGGMMIRTAAELTVGARADISLLIPWSTPMFVRGRVIWVEEVGGVATGLAGVRFDASGSDDLSRLSSLCRIYQAMYS